MEENDKKRDELDAHTFIPVRANLVFILSNFVIIKRVCVNVISVIFMFIIAASLKHSFTR